MCIFASILWSTGGVLLKYIDWNPVAIAGSRSFFTAILFLLYIRKPKFSKEKSQKIGAISYALTVILYVTANKLTSSANAIILQFTAPIFVAILGVFILNEKIKKYDIVTMIVVFFGIILFFIQDLDGGNMLGNFIAILSGLTLAGVTISLRIQKDGSGAETTLLGNILTFLISLPFIRKVDFSLKAVIIVALLGVVQLGLAYILYVNALKYIQAFEAILLTAFEPILNPLWVFLFYGEKPGLFSIMGGLVVVGAIVIRGIYISKKEDRVIAEEVKE